MEVVWMLWVREKSLALVRNWSLIPHGDVHSQRFLILLQKIPLGRSKKPVMD
jgi:hypothetical protein